MMDWYDHGMGWGGWLVMSLVTVALWAGLILGGLALWRGVRRDEQGQAPSPAQRRPDAEQLLDERFARGEIDEDDYARRRELLRAGH